MLRVIILIDFSNIDLQVRRLGRKANLPALRDDLANPNEGRVCVDALVYAALPHSNAEGVIRFHDWVRSQGFQVIAKRKKRLPDKSEKGNLDGELMMDAIDLANEIRPDVIVLATGDGDFAPLAIRLRRKGIRVEVASLEDSLASELKLAAQGYIDLTEWANACEPINPTAPELGTENVFASRL